MMKISTISIALLGLVIVVAGSCADKGKETQFFDLRSGHEVEIDSVLADCVLAPAGMAMAGDELVVANFNRDTIFDVFELPSLRRVRSGGVVGQGPGELSSDQVMSLQEYDNYSVSLKDMFGGGVDIINVSDFEITDNIRLKIPEKWNYVQHAGFLSDDRQLLQCGDMPMNWVIVDRDGETVAEMSPEVPSELLATNDDYFGKRLIRSAHFAAPRQKDVIAICAKCYPAVDFYDGKGTLKSRMVSEFTPGDRPQMWAIYVRSTEERLYVNYHNPADTEFTRSTIVVFDWDGNVRDVYQIGKAVGVFAVDEKNGKIYFSSYGDNDYLYKFDI